MEFHLTRCVVQSPWQVAATLQGERFCRRKSRCLTINGLPLRVREEAWMGRRYASPPEGFVYEGRSWADGGGGAVLCSTKVLSADFDLTALLTIRQERGRAVLDVDASVSWSSPNTVVLQDISFWLLYDLDFVSDQVRPAGVQACHAMSV